MGWNRRGESVRTDPHGAAVGTLCVSGGRSVSTLPTRTSSQLAQFEFLLLAVDRPSLGVRIAYS